MPISSPRTASPTGWPADPLGRRLRFARAVIAIERLLPRLWPAAGFLIFYLALALTGTYCPACGGLRAVNDLTHGDIAAAASSNLLFVASLPFLAVWWLRSVLHGWRDGGRPVGDRAAYVATAVGLTLVVVFWVVRNLPGAEWLTP